MGQGYLMVRTSMANDALPIEGAVVTIKDDSGKTLYTKETNASGETEPVALYAPDKELSLDVNYTGVPYSTYRVEVTHPGFVAEIFTGVQIFDTEEAVLIVDMHPLLEGMEPVHITEIPPHQLVTGELRAQQAPTAPIAGRILQRVIIPDFITVHLGHYTANARNVRVPFPLYVKNMMYTKRQTA